MKNTAPVRAWAKTEGGRRGNPKSKTLHTHAVETNLVASALVSSFFPDLTDAQRLRIVWLAANHDIGKATPDFQKKLSSALLPGTNEIPHQVLSAAILKEEYGVTIDEGKMVGAHHGTLHTSESREILDFQEEESVSSALGCNLGDNSWKKLREREIFLYSSPPPLPFGRSDEVTGRVAGFITLCDHVASSLTTKNPAGDVPLEDSTREVDKILNALQLGSPLEFSPAVSCFEDLTGNPPRAFQDLDWFGPGKYLLEAPTGSGKTEAALHLLLKAIRAGDVRGGYVGLPTTLTSNKIFERVEKLLRGKAAGNLQLAHGKAWLAEESVIGLDREISEEAYKWFSSPSKALSSSLGVGTIDQALLSTIHSKHWPIRAMFLKKKLIICDEVHGYDHYTTSLMGYAIDRWVRAGNSVLCLSATLSDHKKKKLLGDDFPLTRGEFGYSFHAPPLCSSPLPQRCSPIAVHDAVSYPESRLEKRFCKTLSPADPTYALAFEEARAFARNGKKVLWICNTVKDSQALASLAPEALLLHSRFTNQDRKSLEDRYLEEFADRSRGTLLIGSPVLEQSLDIDADLLYTEICPIELLFQRLGRLWRKWLSSRSGLPTMTVLLPNENPSVSGVASMGRTARVYRDHFQLMRAWSWCNARVLVNKTLVRESLDEFHPVPLTEIEKESALREAAAELSAQKQALSMSPSLCQSKALPALSGVEASLEFSGEGDAEPPSGTRVSTSPSVDLVLFKNSRMLINGDILSKSPTPTHADRLKMEFCTVRVPSYLLKPSPLEFGNMSRLGFNKYRWIEGSSEFDYGMKYDRRLGFIESYLPPPRN